MRDGDRATSASIGYASTMWSTSSARRRETPALRDRRLAPRRQHAGDAGVRAYAALQGRDYVIPDDVKALALPAAAPPRGAGARRRDRRARRRPGDRPDPRPDAGAAMIRPTLRAVLLFAAGHPAGGGGDRRSMPDLWPLVLAYIALAALALGIDALLAMPGRALLLRADVPPHALCRRQRSAAGQSVQQLDPLGSAARRALRCRPAAAIRRVTASPCWGRARKRRIEFPLTPLRRGTAIVERLWLRWRGPLGLAQRQRLETEPLRLRRGAECAGVRTAAAQFYSPDAADRHEEPEATGRRLGVRCAARVSAGPRHRSIDWKQSARHRKLLCKEFRTERNHPIVLAFDTGYLMREPVNGVARLDHAINAGLLLAWMSLQGRRPGGLVRFRFPGAALSAAVRRQRRLQPRPAPHGRSGLQPRGNQFHPRPHRSHRPAQPARADRADDAISSTPSPPS